MKNKIDQLKKRIEFLIEVSNDDFKDEWTTAHELRNARLDGMVDALSILTGKDYWYDETGLHEEKGKIK